MAKIIKYITIIVVAAILGMGIGFGIGQVYKKHEIKKANAVTLMDIRDDIIFRSAMYKYDGKEHSITVSGIIPESFEIKYTNNSKVDVGSYDVVASFSNNTGKYIIPEDMKAVLTIVPGDFKSEFKDKEYEYTGEDIEHVIENLDNRFSVTYHNNVHKEPGVYDVYAILHDKTENYNDIVLTSKMTIKNPNEYNVYLNDMIETYNGLEREMLLSGDVSMCNVVYENNKHTDAGEYTVIAHVTDPNGVKEPLDLTATMIINKAELLVSFEDETVLYDENNHDITVSNVPAGVSVEYDRNGFSAVGEYLVNARVFDVKGNYIEKNLTATLKITNKLDDLVSMKNLDAVNDGENHLPEVLGMVPAGVEIKYYNNDTNQLLTELKATGNYNIRAELVDTQNRYETAVLHAVVTIVDGFRVTFKYQGTTIASYFVAKGGKVENYPTLPEESGMNLTWIIEGLGDPENVQKTLSFVEHREPKSYNINYHTEYEHENPSTYTLSTENRILADIEVLGYVFVGWYADEALTEWVEYIPAGTTGDIDLYPYIVPSTYTISYYVDDVLYKNVNVAYENPTRIITYGAGVGKTAVRWKNSTLEFEPNQVIESFTYTQNIRLDAVVVDLDFNFEATLSNGKLTLSNYHGPTSGQEGLVVVPNYYQYEGKYYPVDRIADNTFKEYAGKNDIVQVNISEGITYIGDSAFEEMSGLKTVILPVSLKRIGENAFKKCALLDNINLGNVENIGSGAFKDCAALTNADLSSLSVLTNDAFVSSGLTAVVLSNKLTAISAGSLDVTGPLAITFIGNSEEFASIQGIDELPMGYTVNYQ